ncbi:MAG: hypothetical protein ABUR63_08025 [Verrucomicrobiota bacterium]
MPRATALACLSLLTAVGPFAVPLPARADETPRATTPPAPTASVGTKLTWRAGGAPRLLWTGFRAGAGGGQVLIQTSGAVELETRAGAAKGDSVFLLKRCRAGRRIDQLPLDTRFFQSPVTGVSVRPRGVDLEVTVTLRETVSAAQHKEAGPDGSSFWVLEFPAGATPPTTTAATTTTTTAALP